MAELNITLLAGGVGGAKAAEGLAASQYASGTRVVGNIADDEEFHGLWVSPDIDTLIYSLADKIDRQQGWGRKGETHQVLQELALLGQETWMTLGDLDLATHIYRTALKKQGVSASEITRRLAQYHGASLPILLPTDDVVQTKLHTDKGYLSFQEYFVREHCDAQVKRVEYVGAETATPCEATLEQIQNCDLVVIAPSNPIVSIGAILSVPGIAEALENTSAYVIAISPLIAGKTLKGPADQMLAAMGKPANSMGIYQCYQGFIDALVIDESDRQEASALHDLGVDVLVTPSLMSNTDEKRDLLSKVVDFALQRQTIRVA